MDRSWTALAIKLIVVGLAGIIILPLFGLFTTGQAALTALILTLIGYFLGDLTILPRLSRNADVTAVLIDAVTAILVIGVADWAINGAITLRAGGWILFLAVLAIEEWFFHKNLAPTPTPADGESGNS